MFLIFLLYALLASTFIFAKFSIDYASPIFVIGFRMTLAGLLLLGYLLLFKKRSFKLHKKDLFLFMRVAFFHIYLAFVAEFWSLQYITSSKANLVYSLTPFIAAALSYFLLKERLTRGKLIGMGLGVIGIIPILLTQTGGQSPLSFTLAETILLVAVISAAYAWFDIKKLMQKGYSLIMINGFAMLTGGIGAFITYLIARDPNVPATTNFPEFFKYVSILVILSNVIFYNLYAWLLKRYTITFLTFCGFLSPLFGVCMGWFFRGEAITWPYWVSICLVTSALFIFYKEELKTKVQVPVGPS